MTRSRRAIEVGRRLRRDRTLAVLLLVAVAGLLARLVALDARVAHWDEARVAYWTLRYVETGAWEYRPIVHGPFLPQVNRYVFAVLGPGDASARLVVAVAGGLLPLAAWLFREHLTDGELLAVGALLAANPILLYYSRFSRNDVVLATCMLVAFGLFVRAYDTRRPRYVHTGVLATAVGFTTMGSALLYVLCWLGGLVLVFDHRLFRARPRGERPGAVARSHLARAGRGLRAWGGHLLVAVAAFLLVVVWFYAPRTGGTDGVGLDRVVDEPGTLPAVVRAATVESADALVSVWILGGMQAEPTYLDALVFFVGTMAAGAFVVSALAILGFVADRYAPGGPRDVVALASYWGFASVLGYPLAMDVQSPWTVTHAVVPLAIPAGVGAAVLYRWGRDAYARADSVGAGLGFVLAAILVAQAGGPAIATYTAPQDPENPLVQYAQPAGEMKPTLAEMERAIEDNDGELDVLYYGEAFYVADEPDADRPPVAGSGWYNRLPLPWYAATYNASVGSVRDETALDDRLAADPPVVVAPTSERDALDSRLDGYEASEYALRLRTSEDRPHTEVVIYVDVDRSSRASSSPSSSDAASGSSRTGAGVPIASDSSVSASAAARLRSSQSTKKP